MTRFETKAEDWLPAAIEEAIGKNSLKTGRAAAAVRLAGHVAQMHQLRHGGRVVIGLDGPFTGNLIESDLELA